MQLVECYFPLFGFISRTRMDETLEYASYREAIINHVDQATALSEKVAASEADVHQARFAILVWLDEMILRSRLSLGQIWRDNLLQTEYYQTEYGGEEFFQRMDSLSADQISVRQVYLTCLLLGFKGKYHHLDVNDLKKKISQERGCLPAAWREVDSDAEITPIEADDKMNAFSWKNIDRSLLLIAVVGVWALTITILSFSF
jgi:type VI secretion system protein ImpK